MPDDKLESLMSELRAIELWDRLPENAGRMNESDRAECVEARRRRRCEIIVEINVLLNKTGRDSDRTQRSYAPVSMNG